MKRLLLLSLLVSHAAFADCNIKQASQMVRDVTVSKPHDMSKTITPTSCQVKYRVSIDGEWHQIDYTFQGSGSEDMLCTQAIERGKNALLVNLDGKYRTETITTCGSGRSLRDDSPVKIGEVVMENELGRVDKGPEYFKYKHSKCRLFRERYIQKGSLRVTHGVICQSDNEDWIVVDKW